MACMTNPGVQNPHWKLCESHIACCSGPSPPSGARPSIVVDLAAGGLDRQHQARAHRPAVDDDRARAADAVLAADVGAGEVEVIAQEVGQRLARLHRAGARRAVDPHGDVRHRSLPLARRLSAAACRPRRTRVAATFFRYSADPCRSAGGSISAVARRAASSNSCGRRLLADQQGFRFGGPDRHVGDAGKGQPGVADRAAGERQRRRQADDGEVAMAPWRPPRRLTPVPGAAAGKRTSTRSSSGRRDVVR